MVNSTRAYIKVQSPIPQNVALLGNSVTVVVISYSEVRLEKGGPFSNMTSVFIRKCHVKTDTPGEYLVITEAKTGMMKL